MTSALAGGLFGALQAAQQRIGDEINDFKQEAAQTEVWKQEEERRKSLQVDLATPPPQKQPADGYIASTYGFVAVTPSPGASKFSIDAGPTERAERAAPEPTPATSVPGQGAEGAAALARRVKELEESLREQKGRAVRDGLAQGKQHAKHGLHKKRK